MWLLGLRLSVALRIRDSRSPDLGQLICWEQGLGANVDLESVGYLEPAGGTPSLELRGIRLVANDTRATIDLFENEDSISLY